MKDAIDPITLEVLWNRLLSVVNEQQVTLMRTAFSTVVRESQDLACGVFDTRGSMIAQSLTGTPGHINAMATGVRHFLKAYPEEMLQPGDVLITNDPWQTAGQINDMTILTPVFKDARVVAYFASTCHAPDIGGMAGAGEVRDHACVFEDRGQDRHIVDLASGLPGVVGDQHVTGLQHLFWIRLQEVAHACRHSVDVAGCAGERLRNHGTARIEDPTGQVLRLPHDRAKGGAHQRDLLLIHHGEQAVPEHFKDDRVDCICHRKDSSPGKLEFNNQVALLVDAETRIRPDNHRRLALFNDSRSAEA